MADSSAKELFTGALEVLTTHQVLRYIKHGDDQEKLRIVTGAGMGALGYLYGPDLFGRIKSHDPTLGEQVSRRFAYAAGGAVFGGVLGHAIEPQETLSNLPAPIKEGLIQKPGGLVLTASSLYLAYALLLNGKSEDQRVRHWLMLGSGALGYAYGPEVLQRAKSMPLPSKDVDNALDKYNKGVAFGAISGGIIGYLKGENMAEWVRRQL